VVGCNGEIVESYYLENFPNTIYTETLSNYRLLEEKIPKAYW